MFGSKKKEKFPNIDWWCDNCYDHLNSQSGFHDDCGNWTCTKCGHINPINEDEIIDDDDDDGETLSVWDAAEIYLSNGFDEDYRFGYTHEELMKALGER